MGLHNTKVQNSKNIIQKYEIQKYKNTKIQNTNTKIYIEIQNTLLASLYNSTQNPFTHSLIRKK